jgi:hypothetical protein
MLSPLIEERRQLTDHATADKPNDWLQWLVDGAPEGSMRSQTKMLAQWIMILNFSAIHTTSAVRYYQHIHLSSLTEALFEGFMSSSL